MLFVFPTGKMHRKKRARDPGGFREETGGKTRNRLGGEEGVQRADALTPVVPQSNFVMSNKVI